MKKLFSFFLCLMGLSMGAEAYDSHFVAQHIRKALNLDTRTQIDVSTESYPSGFGEIRAVPVAVNGAPFQIFLSKDEKQYIWGYAIDLTTDPDKLRAESISLADVHSKGSPAAPVTIVEYSDMQCSHCRKAHDTLKNELFKVYSTSTVRLVFKHYPLNGHDWADDAAAATECAAEQNKTFFWPMADFYFENAPRISTTNVKSEGRIVAKSLGLDPDRFKNCVDSGRMRQKVQADKKEGAQAGVNSTPSLFINGRLVRGFRSFEDIKVVVDEKLREAKRKK